PQPGTATVDHTERFKDKEPDEDGEDGDENGQDPSEPPAAIAITPGNGSSATNDVKISCIYFSKDDPQTSHETELTKTQIAEQFDLRYRDLRDIDLRSEAVTRILVRPATILVQFFDLCIIIQADEALLVTGISKGGKNGINGSTNNSNDDGNLNDNTSGTSTNNESVPPSKPKPTPGHVVLEQDFKSRMVGLNQDEAFNASALPFELRAVEAALVAVLSTLREELISARHEAEHSARELRLESGLAFVGLDLLFERSRRLGQIEQKARLVRETIREVLDADEDLAAMYLTDTARGHPHPVSDHQEAEYMLEAYHKAADALVESAAGAIAVIRKKENTFRSALAVQRNQIMFLEARIAIHTLGLAAGTLVAGLFGMNLINYAEENPLGFPVVTTVCCVLSALFSIYGARKLRRIQTLREIQGYKQGER
ncbi:Mitochondrial inner membrane magnesium transporter mrs2, partial [Exophiala dermatitidis]